MERKRETNGLMTPPKGLLEAAQPYDWYDKVRPVATVQYDETRKCWDVFGYQDVHRVLSDYKLFSSQRNDPDREDNNMLNMDPPKHMRYRTLVSQAFTPKAIANLAPRIEQITNELLAKVAGQSEMDVVRDLAFPLPVIVIAEMLGVPEEDRDRFKHWSDTIIKGVDVRAGENLQSLMQEKQVAFRDLYAYFSQIIEQRRVEPKSDLISALLEAKVEDQHLNLPELLSFCMILLVAGNETTTNLIGNAVLTFLEDRSLLEKLHADRSLLEGAIEEVLRYRSPIQSMNRIAITDVELGGQQIKEGEEIVAWIGAANRDPERFERADQYVIDREQNQHLAFGQGIHFCLGAPLARLEAKIALTAILDQLPNLRRVEGATLLPIPSPMVYGFKNLPVLI